MFVLGLNPTNFICEHPTGIFKKDLMHAMESRKLSDAPWIPAFLILNWASGGKTKNQFAFQSGLEWDHWYSLTNAYSSSQPTDEVVDVAT